MSADVRAGTGSALDQVALLQLTDRASDRDARGIEQLFQRSFTRELLTGLITTRADIMKQALVNSFVLRENVEEFRFTHKYI